MRKYPFLPLACVLTAFGPSARAQTPPAPAPAVSAPPAPPAPPVAPANTDPPPPSVMAAVFGPGDIVPATSYDPARAVLTLTVTNTKPPSAAGLTVPEVVTWSGTGPDGNAFSFDTNTVFFTLQGVDTHYSGAVTVKLPLGRKPVTPLALSGATGVQVNGAYWVRVPVSGLDGGQSQSFSIPMVPLPGDTATSIVAPASVPSN